jgi:hypothetical protein
MSLGVVDTSHSWTNGTVTPYVSGLCHTGPCDWDKTSIGS